MIPILGPDNRLFEFARISNRTPSALTAIAVTVSIVVLSLILGQIPVRMVFLSMNGVPRFSSATRAMGEPIVLNVTIFLTVFVALWLWLKLSAKRPFRTLGW